MAEIYMHRDLHVVDGPARAIGPRELEFSLPAAGESESETRLDPSEVRELRDRLTEWLEQIGRDG